jgi:hypothetical protein
MSSKPPPFADYRAVSDSETWSKILSGDVAAFVYSREARGDFEPVPISAAEFFLAEQAGQTAYHGEPDPALNPYQIMVCDRDRRRSAAVRHRIPIPHWVYVPKAAPQDKPKQPAKDKAPRTPPEQARTKAILQVLFAGKIPPELGFGDLLKRINDHVGKSGRAVTKDTLRRTLKSI